MKIVDRAFCIFPITLDKVDPQHWSDHRKITNWGGGQIDPLFSGLTLKLWERTCLPREFQKICFSNAYLIRYHFLNFFSTAKPANSLNFHNIQTSGEGNSFKPYRKPNNKPVRRNVWASQEETDFHPQITPCLAVSAAVVGDLRRSQYSAGMGGYDQPTLTLFAHAVTYNSFLVFINFYFLIYVHFLKFRLCDI